MRKSYKSGKEITERDSTLAGKETKEFSEKETEEEPRVEHYNDPNKQLPTVGSLTYMMVLCSNIILIIFLVIMAIIGTGLLRPNILRPIIDLFNIIDDLEIRREFLWYLPAWGLCLVAFAFAFICILGIIGKFSENYFLYYLFT